ncbi:MAG: hypothetical protein HQ464_12880 [Planctomycetes bacterium]|nr:hypothetical protein [Planctomycetota bacterium]
MTDAPQDSMDIFTDLAAVAATQGNAAMFDRLAASLKDRCRWHALFDLRLLQARVALGLPATGDMGDVPTAIRDQLDELSLTACREVGWPLLDEGQVAAGWMYLRAAATPAEVANKLTALAAPLAPAKEVVAGGMDAPADDEACAARLQEIVHVSLWEGVDPALGLQLVLGTQGTCNAITAYEQAVSRLPARQQEPAAGVLVNHLQSEVARALAADLAGRGIALPDTAAAAASIPALLAAGGGLANDPSIHVDVSHLQSVLRIARVCTASAVVRAAWELACYACRLPRDVVYPGEPPFADVGAASRLFYAAQLGQDVDRAVGYFRAEAAKARIEESGTLPADVLVLLLTRLGRPEEALHAALERPADGPMPSVMQASGMLPSLVELAAASKAWGPLRDACRSRGDEITFAATLAAEHHQSRYHGLLQSVQMPPPPLPS